MFFLKSINAEERKLFNSKLTAYEVEKGTVIFTQGTEADAMFFIELGTIKIAFKPPDITGVEETIRVASMGEFFGEEGVLGEKSMRPYSAIALESGILHVFSRKDLDGIMSQSPATGTRILLELSRNFREILDEPRNRGQVLLFYGPRDGAGRTTLALNTAIHLRRSTGKPVAFLDADHQFGNAALLMGASPLPNISGLLQTESKFSIDQIRGFLVQMHGVDCFWGPEMPQDSERIPRDALRRVIRELRANFPYVVIDGKSHIDENTLLLWDEADRILVLGTADLGFLERAFRLSRLFTTLGYNPNRLAGVLAKVDESNAQYLEEFRKILNGPVFLIHAQAALTRQAELAGRPVAVEAPDSAYMKDVELLVNGLLGVAAPPPKPGFLAKLKALFQD